MSSVITFRDSKPTPREMFLFFMGGILLMIYNNTALWAPLNAVTRDLYNGTLEFIYSNPSSRFAYYVGTVVADALIQMVYVGPMFIFLFIYSGAGVLNMGLVFLVILIVNIVLIAFGVMIGLIGVMFRQINSIAQILGLLFQFVAGAYFPVTIFPKPFLILALTMPFTYGYDLIRYYSFGGDFETILPVAIEWGILALFAVIYWIIARIMLTRVESYSKKNGLHLI